MNSINSTSGTSRRSVLKASAWAVPVVVAAVSAPMAAASTVVPLTPTASSSKLRWHNTSAYNSISRGIQGNTQIGYEWIAGGLPVTFVLVITIGGEQVYNQTHTVNTPASDTGTIRFSSTTPLTAGQTYDVVFTILGAVDSNGHTVEIVGGNPRTEQVTIGNW